MGRDSKLITVLVPLTASGNHYCAWASVSSTDSQSTGIPLQQGWARIHFWKPDFTGMEPRPFVSVPCKASFLLQVATDTIWSSMEIFTMCPSRSLRSVHSGHNQRRSTRSSSTQSPFWVFAQSYTDATAVRHPLLPGFGQGWQQAGLEPYRGPMAPPAVSV